MSWRAWRPASTFRELTVFPDASIGDPAPWATTGLLAILFLVVVAVLLALADADCYRLGGACFASMDRYYGSSVALGLLEHGRLVTLANPDQPYTDHPPIYGFTMAAVIATFGTATMVPMAVVNALLILAAGLLLRRFAVHYAPGTGNLALALLLFNPNVLGQGLLPQTEAMHMAAVAAGMTATAAAVAHSNVRRGAVAGALLGLSALVRPASLILGFILPLVIPVAALARFGRRNLGLAFAAGVAGAVACTVVVTPWAMHQYRSGEGWRISSNAIEDLLLVIGVMYLDPARPGEVNGDIAEELTVERDAALRARYPQWDEMTAAEQGNANRDYVVDHYLAVAAEQPGVMATAVAKSWARFLFVGGEGALHDLFGVAGSDGQIAVGIKVVALLFVAASRALAVIGIVWLMRARRWDALLLCGGLVLWFMASSALIGQPRYRMPAEPALMLCAAVGLAQVTDWFRRRRRQAIS